MSLFDSFGFSAANFFLHLFANIINAFAGRGILTLPSDDLLPPSSFVSKVKSCSYCCLCFCNWDELSIASRRRNSLVVSIRICLRELFFALRFKLIGDVKFFFFDVEDDDDDGDDGNDEDDDDVVVDSLQFISSFFLFSFLHSTRPV